jgi:hypothetical protein
MLQQRSELPSHLLVVLLCNSSARSGLLENMSVMEHIDASSAEAAQFSAAALHTAGFRPMASSLQPDWIAILSSAARLSRFAKAIDNCWNRHVAAS